METWHAKKFSETFINDEFQFRSKKLWFVSGSVLENFRLHLLRWLYNYYTYIIKISLDNFLERWFLNASFFRSLASWMHETQLYPRAISWKISVTPLGKYRPQLFRPIFHALLLSAQFAAAFISTGNLNFNLTTSNGLDPAGAARLNFKWEVSPGQRPRDKGEGGMHHRSPPPFSSSNHPIERRRCRCDPPETHLQFLARGSHAGRVITRRYYTERSFPSKPGGGGEKGRGISWTRNSFISLRSPLRFQSIDLIFHFSFINHVSLPR